MIDKTINERTFNVGHTLAILDINELTPHEHHCCKHSETLSKVISNFGTWIEPIIVAVNGKVILDGHHRVDAAKRLHLKKIPCYVVNYNDPKIKVLSWRSNHRVSKFTVLKAANEQELLPIKTSRHLFDFEIPQVRIDLCELRQIDKSHQPGSKRRAVHQIDRIWSS